MISSNPPPLHLKQRRQLLIATSLGLSGFSLPSVTQAQNVTQQLLQSASQTEVQAATDNFLQGADPITQGLSLDMPALGDNPSAVPVKVIFEVPIDEQHYCEALIILAERNPKPVACRFTFTPLAGTTEVAIRLRLIESQNIKAIARMNDGSYLMTQRHITVTAGGCGM